MNFFIRKGVFIICTGQYLCVNMLCNTSDSCMINTVDGIKVKEETRGSSANSKQVVHPVVICIPFRGNIGEVRLKAIKTASSLYCCFKSENKSKTQSPHGPHQVAVRLATTDMFFSSTFKNLESCKLVTSFLHEKSTKDSTVIVRTIFDMTRMC